MRAANIVGISLSPMWALRDGVTPFASANPFVTIRALCPYVPLRLYGSKLNDRFHGRATEAVNELRSVRNRRAVADYVHRRRSTFQFAVVGKGVSSGDPLVVSLRELRDQLCFIGGRTSLHHSV